MGPMETYYSRSFLKYIPLWKKSKCHYLLSRMVSSKSQSVSCVLERAGSSGAALWTKQQQHRSWDLIRKLHHIWGLLHLFQTCCSFQQNIRRDCLWLWGGGGQGRLPFMQMLRREHLLLRDIGPSLTVRHSCEEEHLLEKHLSPYEGQVDCILVSNSVKMHSKSFLQKITLHLGQIWETRSF